MGGSKLGSTVGRGRGWEDLAPTLINLGSVTVSDWFLLALSLYTAVASSAQELSPSFSSCASKVIHLGDLSAPSIDPNDNATDKNRGQVGRSGRSNLLGDNAGRKTRGHLESLVNESDALNELSFPMNTCRTTELASFILFQCQRWLTTLKSCELSDGWLSKQSNLII